MVMVSLAGARVYAAMIIMTIFFAELLRRGVPLNPFYILIGGALILAIPTLLSIFREGRQVDFDLFWEYLQGGIFNRVFILPMETGLWHVHYAQTYGFFGIQAIPKLAAIFGVTPINATNIIALTYSNEALQSTSANTAYVFSYYSYFGLWTFLLSLILLWLLDLALLVYRKISSRMLLACVAAVSVAANNFVATEYTIALVTNGFIVLLIVSWIVDRASGVAFRSSNPSKEKINSDTLP